MTRHCVFHFLSQSEKLFWIDWGCVWKEEPFFAIIRVSQVALTLNVKMCGAKRWTSNNPIHSFCISLWWEILGKNVFLFFKSYLIMSPVQCLLHRLIEIVLHPLCAIVLQIFLNINYIWTQILFKLLFVKIVCKRLYNLYSTFNIKCTLFLHYLCFAAWFYYNLSKYAIFVKQLDQINVNV